MKMLGTGPLLSLWVIAMGCVLFIPRETLYLKSAQDHAGQDEVRQTLGSPTAIASNQVGEVMWIYQVREEEPGSRWTSTGLWCDEYVLTFDRERVLRRWTHQSHFHGGERMPPYCVPGGSAPKS